MVSYYLRNIVRNRRKTSKNVQSRGKKNRFFSLVTTTVTFGENIKRMFKFLKKFTNIPKSGLEILHNAPSREGYVCKNFLSTLTYRVVKKTYVQHFIRQDMMRNSSQEWKSIAENEDQNTFKWFPADREMLQKVFLVR